MALSLTVNGSTFSYPQTGGEDWGDAASNWAQAVTTGMLQKAGGAFTLTADVDFGANFGLKSAYYKSRAANLSTAGVFRLGNAESIGWRNFANGADKLLTVNASDQLTYDGNQLLASVGVLTASRLLVTSGASAITTSAATATEAGYLSGVTSAIQTQLNAKAAQTSLDTTNTNLTNHEADTSTHGVGEIVGRTEAQTLTNKTLTAPSIGGTVAGSGTYTTPTLTTPTVNGHKLAVTGQTGAYVALVTDGVVRCSGTFTVTLPVASNTGLCLRFKNYGTGVVTIDGDGAETVDGAANFKLHAQHEAVELTSNGTSWDVTGYTPVSGTYTPTLVNATNVAASTAFACQYVKVKSTVTVTGKANVDPTSAASNTVLGISLPIASNFTDANDLVGHGTNNDASTRFYVEGDTANDRASLTMVPTGAGNAGCYFSFTYQIL